MPSKPENSFAVNIASSFEIFDKAPIQQLIAPFSLKIEVNSLVSISDIAIVSFLIKKLSNVMADLQLLGFSQKFFTTIPDA